MLSGIKNFFHFTTSAEMADWYIQTSGRFEAEKQWCARLKKDVANEQIIRNRLIGALWTFQMVEVKKSDWRSQNSLFSKIGNVLLHPLRAYRVQRAAAILFEQLRETIGTNPDGGAGAVDE